MLPLLALSLLSSAKASGYTGDWNFGATGDWSCNSNSDATAINIQKHNPEVVLALGDLSYVTDGTCWFNLISPFDSITRITIGNHDTDRISSLVQYMTHFGMNKQYYSFDYQNVHFISLTTELSADVGTEQFNFLINDLNNARKNPNTSWIVVYYHKNFYEQDGSIPPEIPHREALHPIFDQYGVDLVLEGHIHKYLRAYPIRFNSLNSDKPLIIDKNTTTYTNPQAPIFVIIGNGGESTSNYVTTEPSNLISFNAYGFENFDVTNGGKTIFAKFFSNSAGYPVKDSFNITKTEDPTNNAPLAVVGPNQTVSAGSTVTLDGSGSSDPDGDGLNYFWAQIKGPRINNADFHSAHPSFIAPTSSSTGSELVFQLFVRDSRGLFSADPAIVSVNVSDADLNNYAAEPYGTYSGTNFTSVTSSTSLQLSKFTVSTWFKTSWNTLKDPLIMVSKGGLSAEASGSNVNYGMWMDYYERIEGGFETSSGTNYFVRSPSYYTDEAWHHAAITYDGAVLKLFIDGKKVASKSTTAIPEKNSKQLRIGAETSTDNYYLFKGGLDEVGIWNRSLSGSEVSDLHNGANIKNGRVYFNNFGGSGSPPPINNSTDNPPDVSISSSPSNPLVGNTVTFTATATDDKGLTSIEIFIDGASVNTCAVSGISASCSVSKNDLTEGSHTYYANATDTKSQTTQSTQQNLVIQSTSSFPITVMSDKTIGVADGVYSGRGSISSIVVTGSSSLLGRDIDSITLMLRKVGSPTGTADIGIFSKTGALKKSFARIDVSSLATSFTEYTYTIPTGYTIANDDRIGIKFVGGSSSNKVDVMTDNNFSDPFDGQNTYRVYYAASGQWWTFPNQDLYMVLQKVNP